MVGTQPCTPAGWETVSEAQRRRRWRCGASSASGFFETLAQPSRILQELAHVHARELFERLGVGHDVHPATDQQEPYARAGGRIVDRLVHADLRGAHAALEEEVDISPNFPPNSS
jgi:hypothetical protein